MDHRRSDSYYRRGRSPPRSHYRKSRSRERSFSPQRRRNWSPDRRGRSPRRYSSSWRVDSPNRRSRSRSSSRGRYARRRSRSNESHGRYKRNSSSSNSRSRSNSRNRRTYPDDDVHSTMYANQENQNMQQNTTQSSRFDGRDGAVPVSKDSQPSAFGRGYDKGEIDDEEKFLYGDEPSETNQNPPQKQVEDVKEEEETKDSSVTPGGFDSNALKNVLKAIGFNFEMSAQQLQTTIDKTRKKNEAPPTAPPPKKPEIKPVPKRTPTPPPPVKVEPPVGQKIQTIQSGHSIQTKTPEISQGQTRQFYQTYDPYEPTSNSQYVPTNIQPAQVSQMVYQGAPPTSLGYPVAIPDPNNPGGTLLVYQPAASQQLVPKTVTSASRVVLPPQRSEDVAPAPPPETDERQERLNYLQEELEKLKKQQNELMEKKKKESVHSSDNQSQVGHEEVGGIRRAVEQASGIACDSSDEGTKGHKETKLKYDYLDPGNHWCRLCNSFSPDLISFLSHLHSKGHRKAIDPYDRPWDIGEKSKKSKSSQLKPKSLKGAEFLIPITGYYCTICQTFSGDQICADEHLKSHSHNETYKMHCKKNPSYEKKYKRKKKAAMEDVGDKKKNGESDAESKPKTRAKSEPEEKWVEKVPKIEPPVVDTKPKPPEFKPYPSDARIYNFDDISKPDNFQSPRKPEKHGHSQHGRNDIETRTDNLDGRRRWDRAEPARQQDPSRKKHEKMQPDRGDRRGDDHGRRKRSWSPGYDEYEMQQQRDDHSKHDHRSKDRREHPVNRDHKRAQVDEPPRKKESYPKRSESAKKMPGFGKFTWSSGNVRSSRRFEPAPANTGDNDGPFDQHKEESEQKGKIAIKITGKTPYPARLSGQLAGKSGPSDVEKKAVVDDLKKKVEALKRENALRNQLSSITIPARRPGHGANTAAVMMLGQRRIGKHGALPGGKSSAKTGRNQAPVPPPDIEADVSPPPPPAEVRVKPPPPRVYEPPPPGEEDMDMGIDADARSDASGISMELASDEG